jgi:GTP-binding protein
MRIVDAAFVKSVTDVEQTKGIQDTEVCFIGRSNVGKSSLINSLVARKIARTSSTPGATRLINLYRIKCETGGAKKDVLFSDFPGFGYSKVAKTVYENWEHMIDNYVKGNQRIRHILWLFDVRRDVDDLDEMVQVWLDHNGLAYSLVLTKIDKESRGRYLQKRQQLQRSMGEKDILLYSAKDGTGKKELLAHLSRSFE